MTHRLVQVAGGGPAGLFAARLLKRAWPDWEVRLYERLPAEQTFGFGVGLTGRTLAAVRQADPEVAGDLIEASWHFSTAEFRLSQGTAAIPGFHSGVAIGRAAQVLAGLATAVGLSVAIGLVLSSAFPAIARSRRNWCRAVSAWSQACSSGWPLD